jgi:uncharacterized membrane-anchored protein YhcB (DUF1043 family)
MANTHSGFAADFDPHLASPGAEVLQVNLQVKQARRGARDAQRSAAKSFDRSAEMQDAIAQAYETFDEHSAHDDYRWHAERHRDFAQEDRRIAERLREMAEVP